MLLLILLLLFSCPHGVWADAADDDYAARKAGSQMHNDFDNLTTDIIISGGSKNIAYDGGGVNHAALDTVVKRSGAGSLRFDIPPPPHAGEQIAGYYLADFGKTYKQNSHFYIQYAVRWSPWMLQNTWPTANTWKIQNICFNTCGCANLQSVLITWQMRDIITGYTWCGGDGAFVMDLANNFLKGTTTAGFYAVNGHDYNCTYQNWNTTGNCFYMTPNIWHTITQEVQINNWDDGTGVVKFEVQSETMPVAKKIIHITNFPWRCNNMPGCTGNTEGFNKLELFGAYMTNLPTTAGSPYPGAVYFDELIVSESPIPQPAVPPTTEGKQIVAIGGGSMAGGGTQR